MKNPLYMLLLLLMASPWAIAAAQPATAPIRDLPAIIDSGYLRVAMLHTDEVPFFFVDTDGTLTGIDVELARRAAQALEVELRLLREADSFNGVIDMVSQGQADIGMSYLSVTLKRAQQITYTETYALNYFAIVLNRVARAQARVGNDLGQFLDRGATRIGVQPDSTYESVARARYPNATLVPMVDSGEMLEAVSAGSIDAAISSELSLIAQLERTPRLNYRLDVEILRDSPDLMAPVVHPQSPQLLQWVNTFLKLQKVTGDLDRSRERFGLPPLEKGL